jgi:hypothetical protein
MSEQRKHRIMPGCWGAAREKSSATRPDE